jgi:hypothetical protein
MRMYYWTGTLALQNLVDAFILNTTAGVGGDRRGLRLETSVIDFPSPAFTTAGFWSSVSAFYGVFMIISILYPVSNAIRSLVVEKGACATGRVACCGSLGGGEEGGDECREFGQCIYLCCRPDVKHVFSWDQMTFTYSSLSCSVGLRPR